MDRTQLAIEEKLLRAEREQATKRVKEIDDRCRAIQEALTVRVDLRIDLLVVAARRLDLYGTIKSPIQAERRGVVRDAKDQIVEGGGKLHKERFGTKDYAGWTDQRSDHGYGRGPSRGCIVFSVGLLAAGTPLTDDEIAACLYALDCCEQGLLTGDQLRRIGNESAKAAG